MMMENIKIANLKKQLLEQLRTQNFTNAALCKELISLAERERDCDSIAIGYIWLAESYLLHEENKIDCSRELITAKSYLDENKPSEILENYYSIEYKLYTALYDTQTAFDYCLKALNVAEQLYESPDLIDTEQPYFVNTVENRVVKYYGNIGINFFNHGIYEKALLYCKKALDILESLDSVNVYAECLLRLNIIISLIRTDDPKDIMHHIHLLEKLPIEPESLKIYVDYGYVNYYLYLKDKAKIEFYIHELLNDQIEQYANRLTAVDFYIDILYPVIELKMMRQAQLLFKEVLCLTREDEVRPLLSLAKLKIIYANTFEQKEEQALYQEYFDLYLKNEKQTNDLKINGLETRLKLNENEMENIKAKNQILMLEDIANYDELTKIFNRRYLGLKYNDLLKNNVKMLGLAVIDIDYFKEYNDYYGHLAGDEILKKIAIFLQEALLECMIVCRYGGDEFVVLSWNEDPDSLCFYTREIKATLNIMNLEHKMSHCSKQVTLSIGYGSKGIKSRDDINALFDEVDKALYNAKEKGRNQIVEIS